MTTPDPSLDIQHHLDALQDAIGDGNAKRGFHEEGDRLHEIAETANILVRPGRPNPETGEQPLDEPDKALLEIARPGLRNYYITKLALIGTEVSEAIEELRNGRAVDERWYSGSGEEVVDWLEDKINLKPEGVPSEIADIVIRCFDFADEAGFSLGEIILEKLAFNATRGHMHGGKQV